MKLLLPCAFLALSFTVNAQQPVGVPDILQNLASERATHTAFTFDRDMLQSADGIIGQGVAALNSVTVENYHYHDPAFYLPESMASLSAAYNAAGWKHLVNQHPGPRDAAAPPKPLTDLWLHFNGPEIDNVMVLIRAPKQMSVIEVSGMLRPLDLVHLGGHFGIPKVDPDAVMGNAPPHPPVVPTQPQGPFSTEPPAMYDGSAGSHSGPQN